jgi:integrase
MDGGTYTEPSKTTVAQFLEKWVEHIKPQVSPRTHERYGEIATKNLMPLLGTIALSKLKPMQISAAYSTALARGRRDGKGGLSPRTVHHMHRVLKQALSQAVRWQLLSRNPCDAVDPPKVERRQMGTYTIDEMPPLLDAMRGTRMYVPTLLAVLCGLRRGEIAALRWRGVNLDTAQLAVVESAEQMNNKVRYKEPKSGRARTVAMPATVVTELRAWRAQQAQELLRLGVRLSDDTFVVTLPDGTAMQPTYMTHQWVKLIRVSGLPVHRLHDLRHTHATHLLSSGIHPKVASERLGHSKVGITLDLYSHVMPGMQEDAAAKVDAALQIAMANRGHK